MANCGIHLLQKHNGSRTYLNLVSLFTAITFLLAVILSPFVDCYRIGDVVDMEISVDGRRSLNPLRHMMPKFGSQLEAEVKLEKSNLLGERNKVNVEEANTFSFKFDDGMWELPMISLVNEYYGQQTKYLDSLTVQFVISLSDVGTIRAVTASDIVYSNEHKPYLHLKYEWVEEGATVSLYSGQAAMFFLVLVFSISSILVSCGVVTNLNDSLKYNADQQRLVPKWD
jgi:hypothetical protein